MPYKDPEQAKQRSRERSRRHRETPGWSHSKNLRYQEKHRDRYLAHKAVANALVAGKLSKKPCEVCGRTDVQAHHEDYNRQLDVRWLCRSHHVEADKKRPVAEATG